MKARGKMPGDGGSWEWGGLMGHETRQLAPSLPRVVPTLSSAGGTTRQGHQAPGGGFLASPPGI